SRSEHASWRAAAEREAKRYRVDVDFTSAREAGKGATGTAHTGRTWIDWLLVGVATAILGWFASSARPPQLPVSWSWAAGLTIVMVAAAAGCGAALWRTTRFNQTRGPRAPIVLARSRSGTSTS